MNVIGGPADGNSLMVHLPKATISGQVYLGIGWKDPETKKQHTYYVLPDSNPDAGLAIYKARLGK